MAGRPSLRCSLGLIGTTKPFTWFPLDDAKVRNKPDNNSDPRSSKLPAGGGRSSDKCIVPQYAINKAGATTHSGTVFSLWRMFCDYP